MDDPLLDQIDAALRKESVYIHPSLEKQFTQAQISEIQANIKAHPEPVYVVAWPLRTNDQFNGNTADLLTRLHDAHPEPGVYLATTTRLTNDSLGIDLEGRQWGVGSGDGDLSPYELLSTVGYAEHPTLGAAFVQATALLNESPAEVQEQYDDAYAAYREEHPSTTGAGSEDGDGPSLDLTVLLVAALVLGVLLVVGRQFLKHFRGNDGQKAHVLPPSAMTRIRQAHDRKLEQQARDDVLALGEAIDAGEITQGANTAAWQSALDHYDAARRIMGGTDAPDVLEVIGAIVLSDNGRRALNAAQRGEEFTPPSRCFLNPLHGTASERRTVQKESGAAKVPLCDACRTALTKGRSPDILDVERRGKAVHYFETDAEPWASTGFGSLDTQLVRRLQTGQ